MVRTKTQSLQANSAFSLSTSFSPLSGCNSFSPFNGNNSFPFTSLSLLPTEFHFCNFPVPKIKYINDPNVYVPNRIQKTYFHCSNVSFLFVKAATIFVDNHPPIELKVFAIPKIVPEKLGAMSRALAK